jgi:putative hemolysin
MLAAIIILFALLFINGIFAMSELAMMTSRQSRLQQAAGRGSKGAATALTLSRDPGRFLSTVQVGITLIGILAGAFGENALSGQLEPLIARVQVLAPYADKISLVIVVVIITYFSLVIGELVPKRIALAYPESVASFIARPLSVLSVCAAWPIKVLSASSDGILALLRIKPRTHDDVSEDDVKALIARAATTGVFTPQELTLFQRTMRAGDLVVRDLMVARRDIIWLDVNDDIDSVRVVLGTSPHSHFPVCEGDIDKLRGVVHIKDLIAYGLLAGKSFKVSTVASKPLFVPGTMPALRLLDQFQNSKNHVAFVVDEYGSVQGMLTLNDVTASLVGDIRRTTAGDNPRLVQRSDRSWLVDGRLPLHELVVGLALSPDTEEELPDVSTVAGLVTTVLGHIPREGERLEWQGFNIEVIDMDGARVDKVLVVAPAKGS